MQAKWTYEQEVELIQKMNKADLKKYLSQTYGIRHEASQTLDRQQLQEVAVIAKQSEAIKLLFEAIAAHNDKLGTNNRTLGRELSGFRQRFAQLMEKFRALVKHL